MRVIPIYVCILFFFVSTTTHVHGKVHGRCSHHKGCQKESCQYWVEHGYSCGDLEKRYGCNCANCPCVFDPPKTDTCHNKHACQGRSCDYWISSTANYTCSLLENNYDCSCDGCSCQFNTTCNKPTGCYGKSCEFWMANHGFTCNSVEKTYGCDCSGCECEVNVDTCAQSTECQGKSCDYWVNRYNFACLHLEKDYGCHCKGCACESQKRTAGTTTGTAMPTAAATTTPAITCDGSKIGPRADHTARRQKGSTGYKAPGQRLGATLIFPCRQGYNNARMPHGLGSVLYTCERDGAFRTRERCTLSTTRAPRGVWVSSKPTGCPSACGKAAGLGTPGTVLCSTGYHVDCDPKTKPQPKRCQATHPCVSVCSMRDMVRLASSHAQCTLVMLGIGDPCDCVCTFPESEIRKFASCAFWNSDRSVHEQWEVCRKHNPRCAGGDVVVVHGRQLRV